MTYRANEVLNEVKAKVIFDLKTRWAKHFYTSYTSYTVVWLPLHGVPFTPCYIEMRHEKEKSFFGIRSHDLYRVRASGKMVKLEQMVEFALVAVTCLSLSITYYSFLHLIQAFSIYL